ncbi:anti-sigma B factor RsbW [Paenibacillus sp. GXUN7292]|uniref:anti-sigma B factor RsbW n=1 Tax=Paenibacillus sp. GXUN7292 TaxID=3422499 RepID=UPI003D7CC1B3
MTKPHIHLTIPAQAEYIDTVRLAVYSIASKAGFSYEDIEDMKVAVSEACTNVVLHAYEHQHDGIIEITFELDIDSIYIKIRDYGSSFEYDKQMKPPVPLHNHKLENISPGGLGIYMMQALMDHVEIHTGPGTEIVLAKRLGGNEELA